MGSIGAFIYSDMDCHAPSSADKFPLPTIIDYGPEKAAGGANVCMPYFVSRVFWTIWTMRTMNSQSHYIFLPKE